MGEQVAAGLKKSAGVQARGAWNEGAHGCTLKNSHRKMIRKLLNQDIKNPRQTRGAWETMRMPGITLYAPGSRGEDASNEVKQGRAQGGCLGTKSR